MGGGLSRSLPAILLVGTLGVPASEPAALQAGGHPGAAGSPGSTATFSPILQRFLALDDPLPRQSRALRHLEAENDKFGMRAWMDVWTEIDTSGFRYRIVAEEGSDWIRGRVFRETLEAERGFWASDAAARVSFTPANYSFEDRGETDGVASLQVKPRRKDMLLIDGAIFLRPGDGELLRMEGDLAKPPSFWTRHVRIVRHFQRVNGVRLPVRLDAVATIRFAGRSTFSAVYEYETVNGERVGTPQLRAASR